MRLSNITIDGVRPEEGLIFGTYADPETRKMKGVIIDSNRERFTITCAPGISIQTPVQIREGNVIDLDCEINNNGMLNGILSVTILSEKPLAPANYGKVITTPATFSLDSLDRNAPDMPAVAPINVANPTQYTGAAPLPVASTPVRAMVRKSAEMPKIVIKDGIVSGFVLSEATYKNLIAHTHRNDPEYADSAIDALLRDEVDAQEIAKNIPTDILVEEIASRSNKMLEESKDDPESHVIAYSFADHVEAAISKLRRYSSMKK
jgi:hypothetical protein